MVTQVIHALQEFQNGQSSNPIEDGVPSISRR